MDPSPNFIVPTPPPGDSTNRIANTAFVTPAIGAAIASAIANLPFAVGSTQVDFISGGVKAPTNQAYNIIEYVPFAMTFNNFAAKLSTGTLTAMLSIGATTITGSVLNLGTTQITTAMSALNTAAIGSTLILTVSSVTSAANLSFTVKFTRQLS